MDLVLSSGYLAFARHCGFLRAVEQRALPVEGLCGTSSGALVGALWAAGLPAEEIARRLSARPPIATTRPSWAPWRGLLSLRPLIALLRQSLPARFEELPVAFGVGVTTAAGGHRILHRGDLPLAVAASCAVPYLFAPVRLDGERLSDGGAADRVGLQAWRALRGEVACLVHLVERSRGARQEPDLASAAVVRSPRSGAGFFGLGDFAGQLQETARLAAPVVEALVAM